jgi:hypothetical protein
MRFAALLWVASIACGGPPQGNPWPDAWTYEKARAWAASCPGVHVDHEDASEVLATVVAIRPDGGPSSNTPSNLACGASYDKRRHLLVSVELDLRPALRAERPFAEEVPDLVAHVLTIVPVDTREAVLRVANGIQRRTVRAGDFVVSGGFERHPDQWRLKVQHARP